MQHKARIPPFIQMWSPLDLRHIYGYDFKVMEQCPDLNAMFHFLDIRMMHNHTCMDTLDRTQWHFVGSSNVNFSHMNESQDIATNPIRNYPFTYIILYVFMFENWVIACSKHLGHTYITQNGDVEEQSCSKKGKLQ